MGYIYKIENTITEKFYIGQTSQPIGNRWREHKNDLFANRHANGYLQKAWNKYGADNFRFEVMLECPDETLNFWEKAILGDGWKNHNTYCYNLREGGSKGKLSQETKRKMSEARKGAKNPMWGKTHSKEAKRKLSEAAKKKLGKDNPNANAILITLHNGQEMRFDTQNETAEHFGLSKISIQKAIKRGEWGTNYQTPKQLHNAKIKRIQ